MSLFEEWKHIILSVMIIIICSLLLVLISSQIYKYIIIPEDAHETKTITLDLLGVEKSREDRTLLFWGDKIYICYVKYPNGDIKKIDAYMDYCVLREVIGKQKLIWTYPVNRGWGEHDKYILEISNELLLDIVGNKGG